MLSQQQHNMDPHQQIRQQTTYEAIQTPFSPANQQFGVARRINFPTSQQQRPLPQDNTMVNITNPGQTQQHYLQVAQQHCMASPGLLPQQQAPLPQQEYGIQLSEQEFRQLHHQQLDAQLNMMMQNTQQMASFADQQQHIVKIERSRSNPESRQNILFPEVPQAGLLQAGQRIERPGSALSVSQVDDKRSLHPNWPMHPQRPLTPPNHNNMSE